MAQHSEEYQPGAVFYGVLVGALRMRGTTFAGWCKDRGVRLTTARAAAYGLSRTQAAQAVLDDMIEFAGRDTVLEAYRSRMVEHTAVISAQKRQARRA